MNLTGLAERITRKTWTPEILEARGSTYVLDDFVGEALPLIKASRGSASGLERFRFRQGHWRGRMRAEFSDGSVIERPFSEYGMYQNLYVCAAKKCMFCGDHFGYDDDVCVGDIWSAAYKADPIKHTAMILKTPIGVRALEAAESGELVAADVGIPEIRARRRGGSLARAHCSTNSIEQFPRIAVKGGS
jgi:hypothetical protein